MGVLDVLSKLIGGRWTPVGTVLVVDPNRLNWLYITYNTVEELVRVTPEGANEPATMASYSWADDRTLEVTVRKGNAFLGGAAVTAATVKKAFDEVMRWKSPHPPGTHFNQPVGTTCEVTDEYAVMFKLPELDGLLLGKLRAMHLMSDGFWAGPGFGYARNGTGEGRW